MVSEALKLLRDFHDLTQQELAEKLQVSRSYLSEIESGKKTPSMEIIDAYSRVFKIPKSSLFYFIEALEDESVSSSPKAKLAEKILRVMRWIAAKEGD
jgi:transcriptional regulator with XRE-family HTH domain